MLLTSPWKNLKSVCEAGEEKELNICPVYSIQRLGFVRLNQEGRSLFSPLDVPAHTVSRQALLLMPLTQDYFSVMLKIPYISNLQISGLRTVLPLLLCHCSQ